MQVGTRADVRHAAGLRWLGSGACLAQRGACGGGTGTAALKRRILVSRCCCRCRCACCSRQPAGCVARRRAASQGHELPRRQGREVGGGEEGDVGRRRRGQAPANPVRRGRPIDRCAVSSREAAAACCTSLHRRRGEAIVGAWHSGGGAPPRIPPSCGTLPAAEPELRTSPASLITPASLTHNHGGAVPLALRLRVPLCTPDGPGGPWRWPSC